MKQLESTHPDQWIRLLRELTWSNNYCKAAFSTVQTTCQQHPEFIWVTHDLKTNKQEEKKYYLTPTGIYLELTYKEYYRVITVDLILSSANPLYLMNMRNIEDGTDYYQFLGYPVTLL